MHEVNLLAVLVAGIVPMIVGFLWYGPLFGKRWLALMETTAEEIQKDFNPVKTVHLALMALIAFVLPVFYQAWAYEGRKAGLFWLSLGFNAVSLLGQAVVIAVWS